MANANIAARKLICLVMTLIALSPLVGCVGLVANLLNVAGAGLMPAAYPGLKDKKVAVVCVSNSALFGPTSTATELARRISRLLESKVKNIQVVSQQEVADWIDRNNWDMVDFVKIGQGVDAEMVVAVDVNSLSLHEGKTLYKGRAEVQIVVYDILGGREVFAKAPPEIEYPATAGVWTTRMSEREFRGIFLDALADRIARNFHAYDMNQDVARDVDLISEL